MTKNHLYASFDRHGIGKVYGYGENGFAWSAYIRSERDIDRLPADLVYEWVS